MNIPRERSIFLNAIEAANQQDRLAYLDAECGSDPQLRDSVERLLAAHDRQSALDKSPLRAASQFQTTIGNLSHGIPEEAGRVLGPYRLMEQIGEGGFGVVYVAQQNEPVRRKVALKVVKPGMGSKDVIARFEAERQALAMMDHPNIAKVFDAGVTEDGRPYFVMELVRGIPITEFCDKSETSIRGRLELFADVCTAVQHAHQKGIIHRDLKPSNVLTTLYDDKAVVKIIDFGIAKAIGQSLTDKTIYTGFMAMMGTPLYMSPEQAEMNGLDVDTRSDIYSLGVLLYELLTGTTPIDRSRIDAAGYNEIRRIILEDEPPLPSNRVSTLGQRLMTVSGMRKIEPTRLRSYIQGDLDWIVMKAMDKDRTRRYDSAAAMARDIRCYLVSELIEARPPSQWYRLSRFARRNRAALITVSLVASSLIAGTAVSLYQMSAAVAALGEKEIALKQALEAKQEANAARLEILQFSERMAEANVLTSSGQTHADEGQWPAANESYTKAVTLLPSYYLPWVQRAQMYTRLSLWQEANDDFSKAIALGAPTDLPQWFGVGALFALTDDQKSLNELLSQEAARITQDGEKLNWQSIRNCLMSRSSDSRFDWAKIADTANRRSAEQGPAPEMGRGRMFGGPDSAPDRPAQFRGRPDDDHRDERRPAEGRRERSHEQPGGPRRGGNLPPAVQAYVTGIAYLRAGDFENAANRLREAENDRGWMGQSLVHAPLAMAMHGLGEKDAALESLAKSTAAISEWNELTLSREQSLSVPWFDYVEAVVLHREATLTLTGSPPPVDGRLEKIRESALQKLEDSAR